MHNVGTLKKLVSGGLLSAAAVAGLGLATGTADAAPFHWCPGDPPIMGAVPDPSGGMKPVPIHPAWDTSISPASGTPANHVKKEKALILRQFKWFQGRPAQPHGRPCRSSRTRVSE